MQEGQDWCLHCGAGAPGSLEGGPTWRAAVAILATTALLAVGASVAAYAALTKPKPKPKAVAVAVRPVAPTPTPTVTVPGAGASSVPGIPTTATPPKIPTQTPTPSTKTEAEPVFPAETKTGTGTKTSTGASKGKEEGSKETGTEGSKEKTESKAEAPSPILLDTNAASVYNPYNYPPSLFGDPSLTIDGEASSAWTAQVQPEKAPKMAVGLLLDLKTAQKLGSAVVKTSTTGATVEIYGANGSAPASSITDPSWVRLVGLKKLKKKDTTFKLKTKGKPYRFVVLWLVKAPPGSSAAKPGHVAIDEFELFPPA